MSEIHTSKQKSLVLVVGAGASKEVKLPVGDELKQAVAKSLKFHFEHGHLTDGDSRIIQVFSKLAQESWNQIVVFNSYIQAASLIQNAMPQAQSIDNFIDSHRSNSRIAECGKLAIVSCILKAERASSLRVDSSNIYNTIKFANVANTWFNALFQLIAQSCQCEEVPDRLEKITVISFNYDRCLEHFLHRSLQNYYSMSSEQAAATLARLEIYHPYGTVGSLPWTMSGMSIEYGGEPSSQQLRSLASGVRTFTEGTDEKASKIVEIRSALQSAERVVFLGFAFHPLNLKLLYGDENERPFQREVPVYATAFGLSESDTKFIKNDLYIRGRYQSTNIHLQRELTAVQLFKEYSRGLLLQ